MQKELILSDAEKKARRQTIAQNREKRGKAVKTTALDLVCINIIKLPIAFLIYIYFEKYCFVRNNVVC